MIWTAVGCAHLAALGALVWSGGVHQEPSLPAGGVFMVQLVRDPIAWPGEVKQGESVGAGHLSVSPWVIWKETPTLELSVGNAASMASSPVDSTPRVSPGAKTVPLVVVPEVFHPVVFLERVEPLYPERARKAGMEGQVVLHLQISAQGEMIQAMVARTSGSRLLDEAALTAVRASKFKPAQQGGAAVTSEAEALYRFELR
jgi:TonB family protein